METITAGNGYVADAHDFQLLPNGHVLLNGYYQTPMDMSQFVAGGYSNALRRRGNHPGAWTPRANVVFQWRSWTISLVPGYFPAAAFTNGTLTNQVIDAFQVNTEIMDTDGNLLVSNFGMDVWKINRQTGAILWRLGGPANEFSFVGERRLPDAAGHFSGQSSPASCWTNGNLLGHCNADQAATRSSKVAEHRLDETNKVATLMWSYAPPTNYYAWHYGSAQRLANGNTFIGCAAADRARPRWFHQPMDSACTEVTPDGRVVFQLAFNDPKIASYRAFRSAWPPASQTSFLWLGERPGRRQQL